MKFIIDRFVLHEFMIKALLIALITVLAGQPTLIHADDSPIAQYPLYGTGGISAPPLTMLIMGRDHTLYYEAYNDASDLTGDGVLDVGYNPSMMDNDGNSVDYFGYFDSHLCYDYKSSVGRFEPVAMASNKQCNENWSGDFLNYLTTARIDALRKVLYGGRRIIDQEPDTDSCSGAGCLTVLERSYIPQDAHSWGKEYESIARDGYDISDYTPLSLPASGTRHLFANTTLRATDNPLLRVLTDSSYRIWEWVAIERPVAGDKCIHGGSGPSCTTTEITTWEIVPASYLTLTQTTYKHTSGTHPKSSLDFDTMFKTHATEANRCGSQTVSTINGTGNPFNGSNGCSNEKYLNLFEGQITIEKDGYYTFAVDGDDAVDLYINGIKVAGWYDGHASCNCNTYNGQIFLTKGTHNLRFRHEEGSGGDSYYLRWKLTKSASVRTDYNVRVKVCDSKYSTDSFNKNCQTYPAGTSKPVGVLQKYGEADDMLFGLISGSFKHPYNISGGLLRKNVESFKNEVNSDTGAFTGVDGLITTVDKFRIVDFNKSKNYEYEGGWLTDKPMSESSINFPDWGNPIAEMMYESLRYFSGKSSATKDFKPTLTAEGKERVTIRDYPGTVNSTMDLPVALWSDPYTRKDAPNLVCSPAAQLVISDVNPSYDTQSVPGTAFGSFSGDISSLNAASEANAIWSLEHGGSSKHFIGQVGSDYDGAPTAKSVSGLGNIRGLSPSEPTKQGGYYSAALARYGYENDLRPDILSLSESESRWKQNINTFAVALASPLPRIEIPVGVGRVSLVPFAKSVGQDSTNWTTRTFQPTNTIVDFFIEEFANTAADGSDADSTINDGRPFVRFRINYEDVEQGADHDMDAIVRYTLKVNANQTLTIELISEYAAGGIIHHMGYVISGTTKDGVYLEVRDKDTAESGDFKYFLDTPQGFDAGACAGASPPTACSNPLPLYSQRNFEVSTAASIATVLENPLWYAAKYGSAGTREKGATSENYFLVTNAGKLEQQLDEAFARIMELGSSSVATVAASTSSRASNDTTYFQASFDPNDWSGDVLAKQLDEDNDPENDRLLWQASKQLPVPAQRVIFTSHKDVESGATVGSFFTMDELTDAQKAHLGESVIEQQNILNYLRGDRSNEKINEEAPGYRKREIAIGDIVNSNPLFVSKPKDMAYSARQSFMDISDKALPAEIPGADTYSAFLEAHSTRQNMLYVGANDGMLHAFNADTGEEVFAYVPDAVFPKLSKLAASSYNNVVPSNHQYFVDGSPNVGEAYFNDAWRSVLVATLGAGGRAVFAMDVTDPLGFDTGKVLWEINESDVPELGYMVGQLTEQQVIGRTYSGDWVAIFGNGYDSGANESYKNLNCDDPIAENESRCKALEEQIGAHLLVVDIATGHVIKSIQASTGSKTLDARNGLSSVAVIRDRNSTVVSIYGGDLQGNLWKFDFAHTVPNSWKIAYNGSPLFRATDANLNPQPIVAPPDVGQYKYGTRMIYFGAGQFMRVGDPENVQVQSMYGVWDSYTDRPSETDGEPPTWIIPEAVCGAENSDCLSKIDRPIATRSTELQEQKILKKIDPPDSSDAPWPVISHTEFSYFPPEADETKRGWYIDLLVVDGTPDGQRITAQPKILPVAGKLTFTTLLPAGDSEDYCRTGTTKSMTCVVDNITGGGPKIPMIDSTGDGRIDEEDLVDTGEDDEDGNPIMVAPSCKETGLSGAPRLLLPELPEMQPENLDEHASEWRTSPIEVTYTEEQLKADTPPPFVLILSDGSQLLIRGFVTHRQGWRQIR